MITTLFVGCKHVGRSKNVSNNFDPFAFFPDGEGYMYVRPPYVKNRAPEDLHWGGWKSARDTSPRTPLRTPPYSTDRGGWGEVKIVECPQAVCKLFVRCLCGDVINLCQRSIVPCRKCSKKKVKTKIEKCNHPTPEAYNSGQKVLKKKVEMRLKNVTILHLRSLIPCRKCSKKKVEIR